MVYTLVIPEHLLRDSSTSLPPLDYATQSSGESSLYDIQIHSDEAASSFTDKSPLAVATRVVQRRRAALEKLRDM